MMNPFLCDTISVMHLLLYKAWVFSLLQKATCALFAVELTSWSASGCIEGTILNKCWGIDLIIMRMHIIVMQYDK